MFKVGDALVSTRAGVSAVVVYGPYTQAWADKAAYLVQYQEGDFDGRCSVWYASEMRLAGPKLAVGQKVHFPYSSEGDLYEAVAGPFTDDEGETFWVIKDREGHHDMMYERHCIPVVE